MKDLPPAFLTPAFQERIELPPEEKQGAIETFFTKVREELDIIPKSAVTVSMLAWIIIAKYCDALPLFRQEKILARYGDSITRTTMANWLIRLSLQLQSLINLMADHQRAGHIINADETRIQVLKELSRAIHSDKYMWVTLGGPPRQPAVLFHYDPSLGKEVPRHLFEGFSGYLQTDGYASYSAETVEKLEQLLPWAVKASQE